MLFFFVAAGFLASCGNKKNKENTAPKEYSVLLLSYRKVTTHNDYPATLQGKMVVEIRPRVEGYIESILVQEGASVRKGQLLFRISNPQYEEDVRTAQASIKSAQADVFSAQMNLNKVKPLVAKDIVSKYELESAQYALQAREAALAQAKAALANAQTNVSYTFIRSPSDGVIGTIPYKIGALVGSTNPEPLTTLSDIDQVYAYFSLNEKQILYLSSVLPGKSFQDKINRMSMVSLVLADGSEYPERGKLETASGLISTETGSLSLKAIFPNPQHILRSGASAMVRMPSVFDSALVIPQSATSDVQDKTLAYTLGANNLVHSVSISTIPTDDGRFFIVTKGLQPGNKVIIEGANTLRDSTRITPVVVKPDSVYAYVDHLEPKKK